MLNIFSYRLKTTRECYVAAASTSTVTNSTPGPRASCSGMGIPQCFSEISSCDEGRFVSFHFSISNKKNVFIVCHTFRHILYHYQDNCMYFHLKYGNDSVNEIAHKNVYMTPVTATRMTVCKSVFNYPHFISMYTICHQTWGILVHTLNEYLLFYLQMMGLAILILLVTLDIHVNCNCIYDINCKVNYNIILNNE